MDAASMQLVVAALPQGGGGGAAAAGVPAEDFAAAAARQGGRRSLRGAPFPSNSPRMDTTLRGKIETRVSTLQVPLAHPPGNVGS